MTPHARRRRALRLTRFLLGLALVILFAVLIATTFGWQPQGILRSVWLLLATCLGLVAAEGALYERTRWGSADDRNRPAC